MRKVFSLILSLVFVLATFSVIAAPTMAQEEEIVETEVYDDWEWDDWDTDWEDDWWTDTETTTTYEGSEELGALLGAGAGIFGVTMIIFSMVIGLGMYIYISLALMTIAKRLGYENTWFAWIPILNIVLLFQMGDMNPWLILLTLIPGLGGLAVGIIAIIAIMNICEKRGYDKFLGLLTLIPIANLILYGILAWGKKE